MNRTIGPRHIEGALWTIAAVACMGAVLAWRRATPPAVPIAAAHLAAPSMPRAWPADTLARAAGATVAGDPFRLDRRPADVPYSATPTGAAPPAPAPPPKAPKPVLSLAGIVGGPPWTAVLDGVPGHAGGVVVHAGEVMGDLTVRSLGRDTVVVQGMDTSWTLTLKHPWR